VKTSIVNISLLSNPTILHVVDLSSYFKEGKCVELELRYNNIGVNAF